MTLKVWLFRPLRKSDVSGSHSDILLSVSRIFLIALLTHDVVIGQESPDSAPISSTRRLFGTKYQQACDARNNADAMWARLEKQQLSPKEISESQVTEITSAYKQVIDEFPHTDVAAYCATRLSGFYQRLGRFDQATQLLEQTAQDFDGTYEGIKARFNAGLVHAQARHDPAEAKGHFTQVLQPTNPADAHYDDAMTLFLSAQEQILKCELQLGREAQAREHLTDLKKTLPEMQGELDSFFETEAQANSDDQQTLIAQSGRQLSIILIVNLVLLLLILCSFSWGSVSLEFFRKSE